MGLGVTANRWIAAALACVPLLTGEAAAKGAEIKVSVEESAGAARVWIDAPGYYYSIRREGDRLMVWFTVPPVLATLPKPPRNVLAIEAVPGGIGLTLPPGAVARNRRTGGRIAIDIDDPPKPPAEAGKPAPEPEHRRDPKPVAETPPPATPLASPVTSPLAASIAPPPEAPAAPEPPLPLPPPAPPPVPASAQTETGPPVLTPVPPDPPAKPPDPPPPKIEPAKVGPPPAEQRAAAAPQPPDTMAAPSAPDLSAPPDQAPGEKTAGGPVAPLEPEQAWPAVRGVPPSGPVALIATKTRPPPGLTGPALRVPFGEPVGAALFARGPHTYVVFDERRPIDLASVRDDPMFGTAVATIHPAATSIRLTPQPGQAALLTRTKDAWLISVVAAAPRPAALLPVFAKGLATFAAEAPGQVVSIVHPVTGGTLLVATQRKPGQGVAVERRWPEFSLPETGQGLVVEPLSDALSLRAVPTGFVLSGAPSGLVVSPAPPMPEAMLEAARLTRRFEFPGQSTESLTARLRQQAIATATTPPLGRGPMRRALAQNQIALGFGVEAQTALRIAARDDPKEAASSVAAGLAGIAALLAGRPNEAGGLDDPRLTGTDEVAMWRALRLAALDEGSPAAATILAGTAALLFTYPEELRRHFLAPALEAMILGGEPAAAARLLSQRPDDPRLAYARALSLQAQGKNEEALKGFQALTMSRSQLDHARAAARAVELRLAMGQLDAKGAATALEKLLYAWRGDGRDLALRRRIAELRRQEGAWRQVFAVLRGAKADFPSRAAEIDRQMKEAFASLPKDPTVDAMPPTELIGLLEENADLLADGPDGEPMRARLADKLMALDLPKRADPVLSKLLRAAPIGPARAGFGATLATLRLNEGDGDGALLALSESNSADMPVPVRERRATIAARVAAKRGDMKSAAELLTGVNTQEAEETRAAIFEKAKDWPAAKDALVALAARLIPAEGALDDSQRRVALRLATAAAQAGDDALLGSLRKKIGPRVGTGAQADLFKLLTAEPVRGTADLGRARAEMGLARAVAAGAGPAKPAKTP